ncbi:MAG TPA: VOC family protein [Gaiellales bacterium]|jgi:catechol 2,3-dioxygenase-like lactoylglutathione lyase family enzyme|nr:VOC family protein [Gaiellales bacterium]
MSDPLERLRMPIVPIAPRPEFAAELLRRITGGEGRTVRAAATVRYFVDDLDAAVGFYRDLLGFEEELRPSPVFAMLYRGDLRLLLTVPGEPHVLPDGSLPEPGGHNRISLRVDDLAASVEALRRRGARFRTEIAAGVAVDTVLLEDSAGNPVELFEPRAGYHERPPADPPTEEEDA